MTVLALLRTELRRLTSTPLGSVAFAALALVPLLYGGLYLWGNQDPYGNLKHVPAAVVVADRGTTVDHARVDYGRSVADRLEREGRFDWHELTAAQAAEGLRTGAVDFVVTLPATFSRDLASAASTEPVRASVHLATSDANGYLSSTVAGQAAAALRAGVAQEVGTSAAKRFLVGLSTVRSRLADAAAGAGRLTSGAAEAASGADSLRSGTSALASGASSVASGTGAAASGASEVAAGAAATSSGADSLAAGAGRLRSGAGSLAGGLGTLSAETADLSTGTARLSSGSAGVADGAGSLAASLRSAAAFSSTAVELERRLAADGLSPAQIQEALGVLAPDRTALQQAADAAGRVSSGARTVADGAQTLAASAPALRRGVASAAAGARSVAGGAGELASGATRVAGGAGRVASGADSLASGLHRLQSGTASVAAGARSAAAGSAALATGTRSLREGAATLSTGLAAGRAGIPATTAAERSRRAAAIGDPAAVATTRVTDAGSYGAGLAPFFLSLSAWIGSYALFLILRPLSRRALTAVAAPVRITLAGWLLPALLGVLQMAALFALVTGPLGFTVADPAATVGLLALTAATFAAILLLLNAALGSVGQFLGLILMLVQLVTAGGTFPWQTLPAPLAALHHALPMAYAVDGLRQVMYGGDPALAAGDAGMLAIWLAAALALTAAVAARMTRCRTLRDLQPSLIGG